jgi:hypothetical protein
VDDRHLDLAAGPLSPDGTAGGAHVRGRCSAGHQLLAAVGESPHEQLLDVVVGTAGA